MMPKLDRSRAMTLLTSLLVCTNTACAKQSNSAQSGVTAPTTPIAVETKTNADSAAAQTSAIKTDPYKRAVERASSAYTMGKSAQSQDDWRLVTKRWQQAIELMQAVPASSTHQAQVRQRLASYRQNLAFAQRQANRSVASLNPDGVIILPPVLPQSKSQLKPVKPASLPAPSSAVAAAVPQVAPLSPLNGGIFYAPIVRREGNTPVISVLFNRQPFDMIVDTGASGTLITPKMASKLGVVPVAEANVDTASQRGVSFPMGYVKSIEVGGAVANNVLVAVSGPELNVGLLGHDFFGNYDVTIRQNEVEFRER